MIKISVPGPLEAFRIADVFSPPLGRRAPYECSVVSSRGGSVMTADGVEFNTKSARSAAKNPIDTLVVPGGVNRKASIRSAFCVKLVERQTKAIRRCYPYTQRRA